MIIVITVICGRLRLRFSLRFRLRLRFSLRLRFRFRFRFSYSSSLRAHIRQDLPPLLSCRNADRECT